MITDFGARTRATFAVQRLARAHSAIMRLVDCDIFRLPVGPGALYVERYGFGGSPIILIHGFGTTSFLWRLIAPELAVAKHTAYALDLFGYGASDRPFDADFGVRAQATYVARGIAALGVTKPIVVACDMSAAIALRLAFDEPDLLAGLVLVSPSVIHDLPGPHIRLIHRETAKHILRLAHGLFGAEPLIRALLESSLTDPTSLSPRLVGRFVAPYLGREGVNHLLALARALEEDDLEDLLLTAIIQPTLIVRGLSDLWCSEAYAQSLAVDLPHARRTSLPDTGRLIAEERPAELTDLIVSHVEQPLRLEVNSQQDESAVGGPLRDAL